MNATCSACLRPISDSEILYTPQGATICPGCNDRKELVELDQRAARNVSNSGYSALALAILSYPFNPFFFITIASIASGLYTIRSVRLDERTAATHQIPLVCAWIGVVLAALRVALIFILPI